MSQQAADTSAEPPIVQDVLSSPGQPLDPETRVFMESRFDYDFSQVRVFTDVRTAESARAVDTLVLKMLWGRKLAGDSLSQLSRLCVRNSA